MDINNDSTSLLTDNIRNQDIVDEMKVSYLDYAMSVIVSRALPDARDGLKPVHRRILYAMHKLGISYNTRFVKSARTVGDVIGKYHPHGDTAVYDAMVRMAQDFSMRYPLVKGQGNFGSIDGDNAAAMRYTESKMEKITSECLADIEKNTVIFRDNYDGSLKEPSVFPTKVPFLLLNGTMGIAVGMATNIPPHNLNEVCQAVIHLVDNREASVDDLLEFVKGPDFPTYGVIYDIEAIKNTYRTGRGSILIRGKAEIVEADGRGRDAIIITELPYQVNKANLIIKISDLVRDKVINGIAEIRDESAKNEIRVVIELKKDAFANKILNLLYKHTMLQTSFGMNLVALIEGGMQPKLLNLKEVLEQFVAHRFEVITNRTKYDLDLAEKRRHILDGLKKALDSIDAIIKLIRASQTKEEARENLIKSFEFTVVQADAILSMRLQTLAGLERKKIEDELADKIKFIAECKDILCKPERIRGIIKDETNEIMKQYGDERRTQIIANAPGKFSVVDVVPNIPMIVTISEKGYIKRIADSSYESQGRGGKGVRGFESEDDIITHLFHTKNHNTILFFTDRGKCFQMPVHEIPQSSKTARGQALVNFLKLDKDERVTAILDITASSGKFLFMATTNGTVKKTDIEEFKNVRSNGLIAIKLKPGNLLQWVKVTSGNDQIMLVTKEGKSIRFKEEDVRPIGRAASGVIGMKIRKDDSVVEMDNVPEKSKSLLLCVMENGLAKMTDVEEYRMQSRGGSGVKVAKVTPKTGLIAGAKVIHEDESGDLLVMSNKGQMIRLAIKNIPSSGRSTQGVIIMRKKTEGDYVTGITLIPGIDESPGEE